MKLSQLVIKSDKVFSSLRDDVEERIIISYRDICEAARRSVHNCKNRTQLSTLVRKIESLGVSL